MSKKVIAIDIDDVLAAHAEGFVAYSNRRWGTNLAVDDYVEHWAEMWQTDHEETMRRAAEFHESGEIGKYLHFKEAVSVLGELSTRYQLDIVTSRRRVIVQETAEWIERNFPGVFSNIYHAGLWDDESKQAHMLTKLAVCTEIGADYLIDDQTKHCFAAAESGIKAVLFGDYKWNQVDELPANVTRCHDWPAVAEYFAHEQ